MMNRMTGQKTYWKDELLAYDTKQKVEEEIERLAALYVPQWHYDRENPDIGGTIAKIFAKQMEGNLNRYYQVLDKYHEEFINMMGISLAPAKPAYSSVYLSLAEDTIAGLKLHKGTKFLAQTGDEPIVFESQHPLYLTNSKLETIFMTEKDTGKIIPIRGEMKPVEYLPSQEREDIQEEEKEYFPFPLFKSKRKGIEQNILLIGHESILDRTRDSIFLQIQGNDVLNQKIEQGDFVLMYYTKDGLRPVEQWQRLQDGMTFELKQEKENEKLSFEQKEVNILAIVAREPILQNYEITYLGLSSKGESQEPENVSNAVMDLRKEQFDLFGDTLTLFQECYIGHNSYFSKGGAIITISFQVSFLENRLTTVQIGEEENLKVIKRKPRNTYVEVFSHVYPEEISFEYFNGIGWKKLETVVPCAGLFSLGKEGEWEISFRCPKDWQDSQVGSYQGKCIRIQLIKATNCYLRPAIHHYPQIKNMKLSYSYENGFMEPHLLRAVMGTKIVDLTQKMKAGEGFSVFYAGKYEKDSLYLGLDKKIESGPISIYFKLEKELPLYQRGFKYEYSSTKGFKQMKVVDATRGMKNSGSILFLPPSDFKEMEIEGRSAYWIRISPVDNAEADTQDYLPVVEDVLLNVVEVANIETREEEDYYLEEATPNMSVFLGVENILDISLWVNELGQHSAFQMKKMEQEFQENIRIEYDAVGEIISFFVKWEETAVLEHESNPRSYCLDRLYGILQFGDGIHTKIPRVLDDISFKVQIRSCQGQKGNVEQGTITESMENLMFVNQITNPVKGYGGSNMETVEKALKRGSGLLRNRGRMVSIKDYIEEISNYSDRIDKIRCITGQRITGEEDPRAVSFVLLFKDFQTGNHSFRTVAQGIKEQLFCQSELTIAKKDIHLVEPIFVELSVDAWVQTAVVDQGFEIQSRLQEWLEEFLNPLTREYTQGWEIGVIPDKGRIGMQLARVKEEAMIQKMVVTAVYYDQKGRHEVDLEELKVTPFMVCRSGTHRIHVTYR